MIRHIRRWNKWRKGCLNSWLYKFLVLIGLIKSPTMAWIFLDDEQEWEWDCDYCLADADDTERRKK